MPYGGNLGKQMKRADRLGAKFVGMLGADEAERGVISLRDMQEGSQQEIPLDAALQTLSAMAGGNPS